MVNYSQNYQNDKVVLVATHFTNLCNYNQTKTNACSFTTLPKQILTSLLQYSTFTQTRRNYTNVANFYTQLLHQ